MGLLAAKEPDVSWNSKISHKMWIESKQGTGIKEYHPLIIGYQEAINTMRRGSGSSLESATYFNLPMPALPKIRESHFLGYEN